MLEEFRERIENAKNKRYMMLDRFHVGDTVYPFWLKNFVVYGTVIDIDTVAHKVICDFNGVRRQFCPEDLMMVNPVFVHGASTRTAAKAGEDQWKNSMEDGWRGKGVREGDGEDADNGILCVCSKCGGKVGVAYNEKTGTSDFVCTSCGKRVPEEKVSRKCKESMRGASIASAIAGMKRSLAAAAAEDGAGEDFGKAEVAALEGQYGGDDRIDEFAGWCEDQRLGVPGKDADGQDGAAVARIARRMLAEDAEEEYLDCLKEFSDGLDDGRTLEEIMEADAKQERRLDEMRDLVKEFKDRFGEEAALMTGRAIDRLDGASGGHSAAVRFVENDTLFDKLVDAYDRWKTRRITWAWQKEVVQLMNKAEDEFDATGDVDPKTYEGLLRHMHDMRYRYDEKVDPEVYNHYNREYEALRQRIFDQIEEAESSISEDDLRKIEKEVKSGTRNAGRTAAQDGPDNSEWQFFVLQPDCKIESGWKTCREAEDRVRDLKNINIVGKVYARDAVPHGIDISDRKNWFKGKYTISKEDEGIGHGISADAKETQENIRTADLDREVWEGWTARDFIEELEPEADLVMSGRAIDRPFRNRAELEKWLRDNQPYYKKTVPEVLDYFADKYRLSSRRDAGRTMAASEIWAAAADVLEDGEIDDGERTAMARSLLKAARMASSMPEDDTADGELD